MRNKSFLMILVLIGLIIPFNGMNNKAYGYENRYKIENLQARELGKPMILIGKESDNSNEKINDYLHTYRYQIAGLGLLIIIGFFMNLIKGKDRRRR